MIPFTLGESPAKASKPSQVPGIIREMVQRGRDNGPWVAAPKVRDAPNLEIFIGESSDSDISEDIVKRVSPGPPPPYCEKEHTRRNYKHALHRAAVTEPHVTKRSEKVTRHAEDKHRSRRALQRFSKEHLKHDADCRAPRSRRTSRRREPRRETEKEREARGVERRRLQRYEAGGLKGLSRDKMSSGRHHKEESKEEQMSRNHDIGGLLGSILNKISHRDKISSRHHRPREEMEDDRVFRRAERRHLYLRTYEADKAREGQRSEARRPRRQHEDFKQERDSRKRRDQERPRTREGSRQDHHERRLEGEDRGVRDQGREARRITRRAPFQAEEEERRGKEERVAVEIERHASLEQVKDTSSDAMKSTPTCADRRRSHIEVEGQLEKEVKQTQRQEEDEEEDKDEDEDEETEEDREAARALRNVEKQQLREEKREAEDKMLVEAAEKQLTEKTARKQTEEKQKEARNLEQEEKKLAEERAHAEERENEIRLLKEAEQLVKGRSLAAERAKQRAEEREKEARRFKEEKEKKLAEEKVRMAGLRAKKRAEQKARKQVEEKDEKARRAAQASYRQQTLKEKKQEQKCDAREADKEKIKTVGAKKQKTASPPPPTAMALEPQKALLMTSRQPKLVPSTGIRGLAPTFGAQRLTTTQEREGSSSSDDESEDTSSSDDESEDTSSSDDESID